MALSLRDKLKSACQASVKAPRPETASGDCETRTYTVPEEQTGLPDVLDAASLNWVFGGAWRDVRRENILFLDTETNGLSGGAGTVAFLVGAGYFENGVFRVDQFLMRDYPEEQYLVGRLAPLMRSRNCWCTYNGASFDLPLMRSRFIMCGQRMPEPTGHMDLLHPARRVWKTRLESCSLKRLEEEVLGRPRGGDLPGSLVPERYRLYLRTRDMGLLEDIVIHNRQDILSLPMILEALLEAHRSPDKLSHDEDVFSVGRVMEKRKELARAGECYRLAVNSPLRYQVQVALGNLYRRQGNAEEAARSYGEALRLRRTPGMYVTLSKIYEHRLKDFPKAEQAALKALEICPERDAALRADIKKRIERNRNKQRRPGYGVHGCDQSAQSAGETAEG